MAVDRPDIGPQERATLQDLAAFPVVVNAGPFRLENVKVSTLEIPQLSFEDAELRDVDFVAVRFHGTTFLRCRFFNVTFSECEFVSVACEACIIDDTLMTDCEFLTGAFRSSTIRGWSTQRCVFKNLALEDCRVEGFEDTSGLFEEPSFRQVEISEPNWIKTKFRNARIDRLKMEDGSIKAVTWEESSAVDLSFHGTSFESFELMLGTFDRTTFSGVQGGALRLADVACNQLVLRSCGELVGVAITGGTCNGLLIDHCPNLALLSVAYEKASDLQILNSQLLGASFHNVVVSGISSIVGSVLDGVSFDSSEFVGFKIEDSTVATILRLGNARFSDLRLLGVSYSEPLEIEDDGLVCEGGDAFPRNKGQ